MVSYIPYNEPQFRQGSGAFTENPIDNSNKLATTGFVKSLINVYIQEFLGNITKEPTGFLERNTSSISFNNLTRTFTIQPVTENFNFYVKGINYTKNTAQNIVIPAIEGTYFIYFDATGTIQQTNVFSDTLITDYALVAYLYWDNDNSNLIFLGEERHGCVMDSETHLHFHKSFGARYISGLALQGFTIGDGSLNTHAQFNSAGGQIRDEDILLTLTGSSNIPIFYKLDTNKIRRKTADSFPLIYSGTAGFTGVNGRIAYNKNTSNIWTLEECLQDYYILVHYFGTNDNSQSTIGFLGINQYSTIEEARANATTEISSLTGLPFPEYVPIGTVIFQSNSTYANTPKAKIVTTDLGDIYVDFRLSNSYNIISQTGSHSQLSDLNLDTHLQYLLRSILTTKGDIYVRNSSEIQRLASGNNRQILTVDNLETANLVYKYLAEIYEPKDYQEVFDDFCGQGMNWIPTTTGSGSGYLLQNTSTQEHEGQISLQTGTQNKGHINLTTNLQGFLLGNGLRFFEAKVMFPILSVTGQLYQFRVGFGDQGGTVTTEHNQGVYWEYNSANSVNFAYVSASFGSRTRVISSTPVVANTWYRLGFIVNALANSITFYINGIAQATTIVTNITTTGLMGYNIDQRKTSGTTSRQAFLDYFRSYKIFTVRTP